LEASIDAVSYWIFFCNYSVIFGVLKKEAQRKRRSTMYIETNPNCNDRDDKLVNIWGNSIFISLFVYIVKMVKKKLNKRIIHE